MIIELCLIILTVAFILSLILEAINFLENRNKIRSFTHEIKENSKKIRSGMDIYQAYLKTAHKRIKPNRDREREILDASSLENWDIELPEQCKKCEFRKVCHILDPSICKLKNVEE